MLLAQAEHRARWRGAVGKGLFHPQADQPGLARRRADDCAGLVVEFDGVVTVLVGTARIHGLHVHQREAVELGLRTLVRLGQQEQVKRFRGKLKWEGDLGAMRTDG